MEKKIVFGCLTRQDDVCTEIVSGAFKNELQQIIRVKVSIAIVIHSDELHGYDGLVHVGYEKHFRVQHGKNNMKLNIGVKLLKFNFLILNFVL